MNELPKSDFQAVPDYDTLSQMKRDLSFHPVRNESPEILSREQIEHFNREGYVRGLKIFSREEMDRIRDYFDRLLARVLADGGDSYSISSAHLKYGRVWDLLSHSRIVACVRDLLGPDIIGWGSHFFCKMPRDGKTVSWHQDSSYWPLTPSKAVTVWLAIDDADAENACMRFVAGSHHFGEMTFRPSSPNEQNVLNQTIENVEQYGTIVDDCLAAGEISIHTDLLLHGSEANHSDRRRCGLTLRYTPPEVRAGMDWNQKGVWVHGEDPTGHWFNRSRPTQE